MKVLVTGAAGNLGSTVSRILHQHGHELVLTDIRPGSDLPGPIRYANLLDILSVFSVMDGVEAVVHLGNHPNQGRLTPHALYTENTTMTVNVFQAAAELGVRKMVYASSIQSATGHRTPDQKDRPSCVPHLPCDGGRIPPLPANTYALSKAAGEQALEYYTRRYGFQGAALRFPHLTRPEHLEHYRTRPPVKESLDDERTRRRHETNIDELFTMLSFEDAARLVQTILASDLPGSRVYLPVCSLNHLNWPIPRLIRTYYPELPLRMPIDQITTMYDNARITAETGWTPRDGHTPPGDTAETAAAGTTTA